MKMHSTEAKFRRDWGTSATRLAEARIKAAKRGTHWKSNLKRPFCPSWYGKGGGTWALVKGSPDEHYKLLRGDPARREKRGSDAQYFVHDFDGFREVGSHSDVMKKAGRRSDHDGWYVDSYCSDTMEGYVLALPRRALYRMLASSGRRNVEQSMNAYLKDVPTSHYDDPRSCYVPATKCSGWEGVTIYPLDWFDDAVECAARADHYAEQEAEQAREGDAEYRAEQDIEAAKESIAEYRDRMRKIIADMKKARALEDTYLTLCSEIRIVLKSLRHDIHMEWRTIKARQKDYWTAVNV